MAKVTDLGLLPPDHPIYKRGPMLYMPVSKRLIGHTPTWAASASPTSKVTPSGSGKSTPSEGPASQGPAASVADPGAPSDG